MNIFTKHTETTAPQGAAEILGEIKERYGFIPNLAAYMAESPQTLKALLQLAECFDQTSFNEAERQIIQLTVSVLNGCEFCRTAHTGMGRAAGIDDTTLKAVLSLQTLPDPKLNSLRGFVWTLVEEKGWARPEAIQAFLDAGYTRAQVFEVVLGIALKTLTNYCNHLAGAEPNPEFLKMAAGNNHHAQPAR